MSLASARSKLHESFRTLQSRWDDVHDSWNDQVGKQFEIDYWAPLEPTVEAALRALDRLTITLTQMRHECE